MPPRAPRTTRGRGREEPAAARPVYAARIAENRVEQAARPDRGVHPQGRLQQGGRAAVRPAARAGPLVHPTAPAGADADAGGDAAVHLDGVGRLLDPVADPLERMQRLPNLSRGRSKPKMEARRRISCPPGALKAICVTSAAGRPRTASSKASGGWRSRSGECSPGNPGPAAPLRTKLLHDRPSFPPFSGPGFPVGCQTPFSA